MIGQQEILAQIDNLIEKGFPRFVVLTGLKGHGKTTIANYILHKLNDYYTDEVLDTGGCYMIEIEPKIDNIREMIEMVYKQTEPVIYLIQDADRMSIGAKNSLLKVIEEPPNNAYFIMELQNIDNTLATVKSRCFELKLQPYNEVELDEMIKIVNPSILEDEAIEFIVKKIVLNYYQLELLNSYDIVEFYNYVEKVTHNIYIVSSANSFKLAEKLDLKDDGNGYNLMLFWQAYIVVCFEEVRCIFGGQEKPDNKLYQLYLKEIEITNDYKNKLAIQGINKQALVDMWIITIRRIWHDR